MASQTNPTRQRVLALAAAVQTVKTWRADLVARRRRLRLAMLAINVVLIATVAVAGFAAIPVAVPGAPGSLPTALGLFVVAMLAGLGLFSAPAMAVNDATAAIASGEAGGKPGSPIAPPRGGWSSTRSCCGALII